MAVNTFSEYTKNSVVNSKLPVADIINKFGRATNIGTSFVPVAIGGIYRTPQVSGATKVRVKAGNAADTAGGAGARSVYIFGLDETGALVSEILATNGESAGANSVNDYIRIFRGYVYESGTYATQSAGSHAAAIVIENSSGTQDWFTIDAVSFPKSQTEIGAYTIPLGYTGYIMSAELFADTQKSADFILFKREGILDTAAPYQAMRVVEYFSGISGAYQIDGLIPLGPYPELTDIGFMAKASTGTDVSVDFQILLQSNS